jgi:hypothetical protein
MTTLFDGIHELFREGSPMARVVVLGLLLAVCALSVGGCGSKEEREPTKIERSHFERFKKEKDKSSPAPPR